MDELKNLIITNINNYFFLNMQYINSNSIFTSLGRFQPVHWRKADTSKSLLSNTYGSNIARLPLDSSLLINY